LPETVLLYLYNRKGTPDDKYARESYKLGFDLANGMSLEDAMQIHGYKMQPPLSEGSPARAEFPSCEKAIDYSNLKSLALDLLKNAK